MITEPQTHMIVLRLTDALLAQLQPFMAGLAITANPQSGWAGQEISAYGHFACYASAKQHTQHLTMASEVYDALVERVSGALDYDIRWQPNEYEPDGFVERVHPLELMGATHMPVECSTL